MTSLRDQNEQYATGLRVRWERFGAARGSIFTMQRTAGGLLQSEMADLFQANDRCLHDLEKAVRRAQHGHDDQRLDMTLLFPGAAGCTAAPVVSHHDGGTSMVSYSQREIFSAEEILLLNLATAKDHDGREVRCHELARYLSRVLDVAMHDGKYGPVDHSWCLTCRGNILDPYAVGSLPHVQLIDTNSRVLSQRLVDDTRSPGRTRPAIAPRDRVRTSGGQRPTVTSFWSHASVRVRLPCINVSSFRKG